MLTLFARNIHFFSFLALQETPKRRMRRPLSMRYSSIYLPLGVLDRVYVFVVYVFVFLLFTVVKGIMFLSMFCDTK